MRLAHEGELVLVAALFALHPLHVESVAWVTERKDVLSTFFALLSIWAYAAYARRPGVGRYLVVAALLGAEEFGIGTAALVAMGCNMVRQCHSNTCPVGVCTQDEKLREKFTGSPEKVVNLFSFIAEEVRETLAFLGARSLDEIESRRDELLQMITP